MAENIKFDAKIDQVENAESSKGIESSNTVSVPLPEEKYKVAFLKNGIVRGITYQVKIILWAAWKLMYQSDANISDWCLAAEMSDARGFHDLVLKYVSDGSETSKAKCMYRFVQIKHKQVLRGKISVNDLMSRQEIERQYSLIYLFKAYLNLIENIPATQVQDLTVFTNKDIHALQFLVPVNEDKIFGFEKKGTRYRIDVQKFQTDPNLMTNLKYIRQRCVVGDCVILDFLRKLVFIVGQPSEFELEELIVKEMGKVFQVPQIFYNDLYKNIIKWFLINESGEAPYLTKGHVIKYLKNTHEMLLNVKKAEIDISASKLIDKLKFLSV